MLAFTFTTMNMDARQHGSHPRRNLSYSHGSPPSCRRPVRGGRDVGNDVGGIVLRFWKFFLTQKCFFACGALTLEPLGSP